MNVCLSTTKTLRGATVGMFVHVTFNVDIWEKIPNNFNKKIKVLQCGTFMNVCLSTTKTLRGATVGMLVHITFNVDTWEKIPINLNEKIQSIRFVF